MGMNEERPGQSRLLIAVPEGQAAPRIVRWWRQFWLCGNRYPTVESMFSWRNEPYCLRRRWHWGRCDGLPPRPRNVPELIYHAAVTPDGGPTMYKEIRERP